MPDNNKLNYPSGIPRIEALRILKENTSPVTEKEIAVTECSGCIACRDIYSGISLPEHDRSAMDGFAVTSSETAEACADSPLHLKIRGEIRPSETSRSHIESGCAIRVLTGGIIPQGADAVIPFERVEIKDGSISITAPVQKNEYIRKAGSDIMKGALITAANKEISPCDAALLAYAGIRMVPVRRPLSITVLAVGNELCDPSLENICGLIPADNLILLKALCQRCRIEDISISKCDNNPESISRAVINNANSDMIITTGGTGPGNRDFVFNSVIDAGGTPLFKGLAMHPAKSVFAFKTTSNIVIGLPGPPNAVNLAFHTIIKPALNILRGMEDIAPLHTARLKDSVKSSPGREKMRPCLITEENGRIFADPLTAGQLSPRKIMSLSNGIIVLPPDSKELQPGNKVQVIRYC